MEDSLSLCWFFLQMEDIDAMFSDLLGEMDLLTQVSLHIIPGVSLKKQTFFTFSIMISLFWSWFMLLRKFGFFPFVELMRKVTPIINLTLSTFSLVHKK